MGPKPVNCCRPEQMGTKESSNIMKRIQTLEGRVPAKEAQNWRIDGEKKRVTREEYKRLLNNFEMEGSVARKGEKIMKESGELPNEEGDAVREYNYARWKLLGQLAKGG